MNSTIMKMTEKEMALRIKQGKQIVFLTGAGVSTPSGIPDYRSIGGFYTESGFKEPEYLLSRRAMLNDTEDFYAFIKKIYHPDSKPNLIHQKMARLQEVSQVTIITQNIDDLHIRAGSRDVVEFHGNIYRCHCEKCETSVPFNSFLESYIHETCGGILRPDVVLYDEQIDSDNILRSQKALEKADTVVVVGTSFKVYPFAGLIRYANPNAEIYAVNKEKIALANLAGEFIGDAMKVFELL